MTGTLATPAPSLHLFPTGFSTAQGAFPWPMDGEVHLHVATLACDTVDASNVFSLDELARARRFRRDRDRRRFLAGRAFLRVTLARYLGNRPEVLGFSYSPHGKPALVFPTSLRFNLSHAGDSALLGVATADIGVDVERIRVVPEIDDIAQRFFAPSDAAMILAADAARRLALFFACWTRNEAMVKAVGGGLREWSDASVDRAERPLACLAPDLGTGLSAAIAVRHRAPWIGASWTA